MKCVLLCGGNGERLWPLSRQLFPKQFIKLFAGKSLFQKTLKRNENISEDILAVTNIVHYSTALEQTKDTKAKNISFILETKPINTAAAIALACMASDEDAVILAAPADHIIKDIEAYEDAVKKGEELAKKGNIAVFTAKPSYPETGYGYIKTKDQEVISFKEKPDYKTASKYFSQGDYYWNSGIFCFRSLIFLKELEKHSPDIFYSCKKAFENSVIKYPLIIDKDCIEKIPVESVDYAVMEKSSILKAVKLDAGWSDMGSFDSLYNELPKDEKQNTVSKNFISIDSAKNLVISEKHITTAVGINDSIIIDTEDALLIAKKGASQSIKEITEQLKLSDSDLLKSHPKTFRLWGYYKILEQGERYKVKHLKVKPGKSISLQKHFQRSEHWIVVKGTASVTIGEEKKLVSENNYVYIPKCKKHRLKNPGKDDLILIEVQTGKYLKEDDIKRYNVPLTYV